MKFFSFPILILIGIIYFNGANGQTQVIQSSKVKTNPFSLKGDLQFEADMINKERNEILKTTSATLLANKLDTSKDIQTRLNAIHSLGYVADDYGRKRIENLLLTDTSDEVRLACAKALRVIRTPESTETLIKALSDKNRLVRIYAGEALALAGEKKESLKFFTEYYSKKQDEIPYYSCHIGFLYIGTSDVVPYLLKDTSLADPNLAIDAAIILAQIGYGADAFPFLKKNLSNPEKYIRMAALRGLAYIGDSASLQLIESMISDPERLVKERVVSILEKFQ